MQKQTNKILSVLLAVIMILSAAPTVTFTAFAETEGIFTYSIYNGEIVLTGLTDKSYSGELNIPSTLGGYTVTSIDWFAFSDCTKITSAIIPDSVNYIDRYAFSGCTGLTDISIPNSISAILEGTFEDCTGLKTISIPDSVTSIGYCAFSGCTELSDISMPSDITSIHDGAFKNTAYYNNTANWENDVLYIDNYLLKAKDDLSGNYSIKPGTKLIAHYAFWGCKNISDITIPDGVKKIGEFSFRDCTGITNIVIPDSITTIDYDTFGGCEGLRYVTISKSVNKIDCAFSDCKNITDVFYTGDITEKPEYYTYGNEYLLNATWHYNYAPHVSGDINNDDKVNNKDLTRLFQYLSKWNVEVNAAALDINGDGKVNNKDLTRLFQYLSKWDVEIF